MAHDTIARPSAERGEAFREAPPRLRVVQPARRTVYPLHCPRCGEDCTEQRGGQLRPDDYVELWHEHCEMQAEQRTMLARAQRDLEKALLEVEYLRSLLEHLDPFLPRDMQNEDLRAQHPQTYDAIAEHLDGPFGR